MIHNCFAHINNPTKKAKTDMFMRMFLFGFINCVIDKGEMFDIICYATLAIQTRKNYLFVVNVFRDYGFPLQCHTIWKCFDTN